MCMCASVCVCVHVHTCTMCMQVPTEAKMSHLLEVFMSGLTLPLKEPQVILITVIFPDPLPLS